MSATLTISRPGNWDDRSSFMAAPKIIACPNCNNPRRDLGGPHAPHFNADGVLVDCTQRPIGGAR